MGTAEYEMGVRANELDADGESRVYRMFRQFWHPVSYSHELDDRPQRAFLCGEQLAIVRLGDQICAFADLCAHRGTPLSLGTVENNELRCCYHGWQYDAKGDCTFIPQRPDLSRRLGARIKRYPAVERYGLIWVCLDETPRFPLPEFPQYDDPTSGVARVFFPPLEWACTAPRRVENITDLGHFPILHDGLLGFRGRPEVAEHLVWRAGNSLRMQLAGPTFLVPNNPRYASLNLGLDVLAIHRQWWLFMPLTVVVQETGPGPGHLFCLLFHPTPLRANRIRDFVVAVRNYATGKAEMDALVEFSMRVIDQDKPVVEGQRPQTLPEDLSQELHVKGVDVFSIEYRRWLVELAREPRALKQGP